MAIVFGQDLVQGDHLKTVDDRFHVVHRIHLLDEIVVRTPEGIILPILEVANCDSDFPAQGYQRLEASVRTEA
jgi:hypothetical protein